jgi:hypothetical protein
MATSCKLDLSVCSASLKGEQLIDGRIVRNQDLVIKYHIRGLPPQDAANVVRAGSLLDPVWRVQRWINGEYRGYWGEPFASPQAAVAALEQDINK